MSILRNPTARLLAVASLALGAGCDNPDVVRDLIDQLGHHRPPVSRSCGGVTGATCAKNEVCETPAGTCSAAGVCRPRPEVCTAISAPVCGCDNKTYGNDCERAAAGVGKLRDGACSQAMEVGEGEQCGGFTLPPGGVCKAGLFCMQGPGLCNTADIPGTCEVTPTACTKELVPVCGCDGKTYGNDCLRRAARIPLDHAGACTPRGGQEGAMCGGIAGLQCNKGLFCDFPANMCRVADLAGVCRVSPQACDAIFKPVCGCDGKTYGNDCERQVAGVAPDHDGACSRVIEVGEGEQCGGFTLPPGRVCKAGLFCMQGPGLCGTADIPGTCEVTPTACTREFVPVCGCDRKTYGNDCLRRAARIPLDHAGACVPRGGQEGAMCGGFAGLQCDKGLFCEFPANMCQVADLAGVCRVRPQACTAIFKPVCACGGKTFGNDCERQVAGAALDHDGACVPGRGEEGALCGGIAGFPCNKGLFCEFPENMCRVADLAGVCRVQPRICADIFKPVCGCDGKTYGNDCERQAAGAAKAHDGACS